MPHTSQESVRAEAMNLLKDALGKLGPCSPSISCRRRSWRSSGPQAALALPGHHRATKAVDLSGSEAGRDHRDLHHLLLGNRHAKRSSEHLLERLAWVCDGLLPLAPRRVRMNHAADDEPEPDNEPPSRDAGILGGRVFPPRSAAEGIPAMTVPSKRRFRWFGRASCAAADL